MQLADHRFGHNKSWLLLTPKFYNLFVPLIYFFKFLLPFGSWYNTSSLPNFLSENVIDPALSHIYDPIFQFRNFSLTSLFSCRFSVFQDPYSTWIPTSYFRVHHISRPHHFTEVTILRKFFCLSFRGKRLKFSLLQHTSSDVKKEWCYVSSHICLRHSDRYIATLFTPHQLLKIHICYLS
jgi:hypothetical protein